MKRFNIFKSGTHTDAGGSTLDFSEDTLQASVNAYNPKLHEAPIVVGHPKDNGPAYGWIKSLDFSDGDLFAEPHQVNADFEEMVKAGSFKKVSASFYLPDSPSNPSPGNLYLRHLGFLGAQPPAIKGLSAVEFNEADEGTVEFQDAWEGGYNTTSIARLFKNVREFLIDKFSKEDADSIIPDYAIEELKNSGEGQMRSADANNFNEPKPEDSNMDLEQAQARIDELQNQNSTLEADNTALKGKVASFQEQQAAVEKSQLEDQIESLVTAGNITPAEKPMMLAFAEILSTSDQTVEFGEEEDKQQFSGKDGFMKFLSNRKAVDFSEQSQDQDNAPVELSSEEIARQAASFQEAERKEGRNVDVATAVNHILNQAN